MKYLKGKSYQCVANNNIKFTHKIYKDFYCSIIEWYDLSNEKANFMYQLRDKIAEENPELWNGEFIENKEHNDKLRKLSFDRTGRRDNLDGEIYSARIIFEVIKKITKRESVVNFYSWKGNVNHVEISFSNSNMPNIIMIEDENCGSTNDLLIRIMNAIYDTLKVKTTAYYDGKLDQYYTAEWDKVYDRNFKSAFHKKADRVIPENENTNYMIKYIGE